MVSKCANPKCSASFRYFHKGKLFRIETLTGLERRRAMGRDGELGQPMRRTEFFWLCEDCAAKMTLVFDRQSGVGVRANDYAGSVAA
jgi:hypothetical protein